MPTQLSEEEREQILQTIQMFEMITQTQPDDYQSYDVLKEAYLKLGRDQEAADASRKLAEAYLKMGLYSSAMLECEGILNRDPEDAEIVALMGEIEQKMHESSGKRNESSKAGSSEEAQASLTAIAHTKDEEKEKAAPFAEDSSALQHHGNDSLAKFLIDNQLADSGTVEQAMHEVSVKYEAARDTKTIGPSLLAEIEAIHNGTIDDLMSSIIDATRFAFIPLVNYDVDRQIVRMLPEELTLNRLIVPFDLISRTLMIALVNPFDGEGKKAAQNSLDYNIQWFIAKPNAVQHVLKDIYK